MTQALEFMKFQTLPYYISYNQAYRNNLIKFDMQTRYETLLDQLHTNKRQLTQYRQKHLNLQNQLNCTQQQNRNLKRNYSNLQDQCNRLTQINKNMQIQKEQLMKEYSTSIQSIKDQINKKQNEIYSIKQTSFSPQINQKLIEKQIRCDVQNQFNHQLESKDERIKQLQSANDRLTFQKQIQQQKYSLKLQSLQKQLRQMQNSHLVQLQNYANKTYNNSQSKSLYQQQSIIKKLKKQIDQLRARLDNSQQQLSQNINQRNRIQKQHSSYVIKNRQQTDKLLEEIRVYKTQATRLHQVADRNKEDRDNWVLKDKEKQIRKLKSDIQQLHEQIQKKERKQSQKQIQISNLRNELKSTKQTAAMSQNQIIRELKSQKQNLKRQIVDMRHSTEVLKNQFSELQKTSINQIQNIYKNTNNANTKTTQKQTNIKKLTINTEIIDKSFEEQFNKLNGSFGYQSPKNIKNQSLQNQKKYYEQKLQNQQRKIKQIAQKYVQLKKKYNHLDKKFKQANQKVVQLLKTKIQLGSPTNASRKTFEFPNSPHLKMMYSPKNVNMSSQNYDGVFHSKTQGNLGQNLMKQKFDQNAQRSSSKQLSFYERSLNIRNNQKMGELRCINHDNSRQRSQKCSHSKSPIK